MAPLSEQKLQVSIIFPPETMTCLGRCPKFPAIFLLLSKYLVNIPYFLMSKNVTHKNGHFYISSTNDCRARPFLRDS